MFQRREELGVRRHRHEAVTSRRVRILFRDVETLRVGPTRDLERGFFGVGGHLGAQRGELLGEDLAALPAHVRMQVHAETGQRQ